MCSPQVSKLYSCSIVSCVVIIFIALAGSGAAGDVVKVTANDFDRINLVDHMELLQDPTRAFSITDVAQSRLENAFVAATRRNTNIGFSSSAYWLRFSIEFAGDAVDSVRLVVGAVLWRCDRSWDRICQTIPGTCNTIVHRQSRVNRGCRYRRCCCCLPPRRFGQPFPPHARCLSPRAMG